MAGLINYSSSSPSLLIIAIRSHFVSFSSSLFFAPSAVAESPPSSRRFVIMPYDVKSSSPAIESVEFICDWCGKPIAWTGPDVHNNYKEPVHEEVRYGVKSKRKHYYLHRLCHDPWSSKNKERHAQLLADDRALRGADPKTGRKATKGQTRQSTATRCHGARAPPVVTGSRVGASPLNPPPSCSSIGCNYEIIN